MELRKEIFNLRQLLDAAIDPDTRRELRRELNLLTLRFNCMRRPRVDTKLSKSYAACRFCCKRV
jgi:hypothetical protein